MSPFLIISLPHVGEALDLLVTITSTLSVYNFKIGFALVVREGGGPKGRGWLGISAH